MSVEPIPTCISSENFTLFAGSPNIFYLIDNINIYQLSRLGSLKPSGFFTFCHNFQGFKNNQAPANQEKNQEKFIIKTNGY